MIKKGLVWYGKNVWYVPYTNTDWDLISIKQRSNTAVRTVTENNNIQYIPRNMHTVFALLCFVVVIHWLIFPYPSGLLHWHCGNLTIAPVPAKQPWWIWINTSREFIMNHCITTTKQSTTKPCAYFLGYTVQMYLGRLCIYLTCFCLWSIHCQTMFFSESSLLRLHWLEIKFIVTYHKSLSGKLSIILTRWK